MGAAILPVLIMSVLWGIVGIVLPFVVPKGPNRGLRVILQNVSNVRLLAQTYAHYSGVLPSLATVQMITLPAVALCTFKLPSFQLIIQLVLMLTGATCWLFWLCCYMAQMNPLIGPKIENKTLLLMAREWTERTDLVY